MIKVSILNDFLLLIKAADRSCEISSYIVLFVSLFVYIG